VVTFLLGTIVPIAAAQAQGAQTLPGLIVTVPPTTPAPAEESQPAQKAPAEQSTKGRKNAGSNKNKSATLDSSDSGKRRGARQSIVVLVNDDPITDYQVEQRSRLMAMQANIGEQAQANFKRLIQQESTNQRLRQILHETIQANPGKSREEILAAFERRKQQFAEQLQRQAIESARAAAIPAYRKKALDELIEERLKLQEAQRLGITIDDSQVDDIIKNIAARNKKTPEQFAQDLKRMGVDVNTMRERFRATLAWNAVVRRRFSAQVAVSQRDIDRMISSSAGNAEDQVELRLHRVTLPVTGKLDQKVMAQKLDEAERVWRNFKGCSSTAALSKQIGAKFEDLGPTKPSAVPEPTRSLLLNAKDGEMVPPNMSSKGVELYAVCGRKVIKANEQVREQVAQELQQKEFEVLAERHLRDLRQDAHIEYR
jgi:peptidyl-prolyl cis-trans isomerase SurA